MITIRDRHGTVTRKRKAGEGETPDRASTRYFAVHRGVWSKGYKTRREAERAESKMKNDADDGIELGADRMTLADFIAKVWMPDALQRIEIGVLDRNTLQNYEMLLDTHIVPKLGAVKLRDLKPQTLQKFYIERKKTRGWKSAKSMLNLHSLVSSMLSLAVDRDYLTKNPAKAKNVRPGDRGMPAVRSSVALTPNEARTLLDATSEHRLAAAWRLTLVGGLRRGEVLGLEWSDVDLDEGRVQLQRTWKTLARTRENVIGPIKTGKNRTITVDERTVAMLRAHRAQQSAERLAVGELWHNCGAVFTDELGNRLDPDWVSDEFKRVLGKAVRAGHLHELRHTAITMAVNSGMPIHVAAERFGHSPEVMLGIYSHVARGQEDAAAVTIAGVIDG